MAMKSTGSKYDQIKHDLLRDYRLKAVQHTCLLEGKKLKCCACPKSVTTDFYMFEVTSRATGAVQPYVYAGKTCAERLIEFSRKTDDRIEPLERFYPFSAQAGSAAGGGGGGGGSGNGVVWAPVNRELYETINVVFLALDLQPGSKLSAILDEVMANPGRVLPTSAPSLNTIIGKTLRGRHATLTDCLTALRRTNPRLREYRFELLRAALANLKTPPTVVYL